MKIQYTDSLNNIKSSQLNGFFVGWEKRPSHEVLFKVLNSSDHIVLAVYDDKVVGFATAISDGVLSAYIPLVEVLPEYKKKGIGSALVEHLLKKLENIYMIDLLCDEEVEGFYKKFGFHKTSAMMLRHYDKQSGES